LLVEGCARLQAGETLLVFPEATRTPPGRLPEFRLGAAELLVRSGATLYPVVIFKAGAYLSKSRAWYEFPKQPEHWHIEFDRPLAPDCSGNPRLARRRINAQLQEYFHQRLTANRVATAVARTMEPAEN
jgi:1-acyl-sn-glycerol-3-phosphate acyltransferase